LTATQQHSGLCGMPLQALYFVRMMCVREGALLGSQIPEFDRFVCRATSEQISIQPRFQKQDLSANV
jgi:hypothetical protein